MINQNKERIMITLSKKQIEFLDKIAKNLGISKSKVVSFLIDKNIMHFVRTCNEEERTFIKELTNQEKIRIAKLRWLND